MIHRQIPQVRGSATAHAQPGDRPQRHQAIAESPVPKQLLNVPFAVNNRDNVDRVFVNSVHDEI